MWWWMALAMAVEPGPVVAADAAEILTGATSTAPAFGWFATIADDQPGRVRVRVTERLEDAEAWFDRRAETLSAKSSLMLGVDEAAGDGALTVVFRQQTLVVEIHRPGGEASDLARRLIEAIEYVSWPAPPSLTRDAAELSVSGDWAEIGFRRAAGFGERSLLPVARPVCGAGRRPPVWRGPVMCSP